MISKYAYTGTLTSMALAEALAGADAYGSADPDDYELQAEVVIRRLNGESVTLKWPDRIVENNG